MVASTIVGSITLATPAIAAPVDDASGQDQAKAFLYYKALAGCFKNGGDPRISTASLAAGNWFLKNTSTGVGVILNSTDGRADCRDSGMVKAGLTALGYSDYRKAWCDTMKYANVTSDCAVAGEAYASGDRESSFKQSVEETYWGSRGDPTSKLSAQARYYLYYNTFMTGCKPKQIALFDSATDDQKTLGKGDNGYIVGVIGNDGKTAVNTIFQATEGGTNDPGVIGADGSVTQNTGASGVPKDANILTYDGFTPTCAELAQWTNDAAQGIDPNFKAEGSVTGANTDDKSSCTIEGIGWIVCPVLNFMGKLNDAAFSFIATFLETPSTIFTDSNVGLQDIWGKFRDVANILFVIAFMAIVYSQITSAGISNYGLKKMLPKLIIAAILVNSSYLLCQLAVDITNILGYTLNTFIGKGIFTGTGVQTKWVDVTGNILAGGAAVGAVIALVVLCFTAPIVLLVLAITLLTLVIRQVLIILLIVVAPVAFVAYLLPNTEQFFKKWWKMFSTLLMLFPIIAVLFGASTLASKILQSVGAGKGGLTGAAFQVMALVAAAVPLGAAPALLKGSLAAAGAIGAKVAGLQNKANKSLQGSVGDTYKGSAFARGRAARKAGKEAYRNQRYAAGVSGHDTSLMGRIRHRASRGVTGRSFTASGEYAQDRLEGAAVETAHKATREAVEREEGLLSEKGAEELLDIAKDENNSTERRAAALKRVSQVGGHQHVQAAYDYLDKQGAAGGKDIGDIQQLASSELLKRKPAGVKTSAANAMATGTMGKGKKPEEAGYMNQLQTRFENGEFGAGDYASMDKDDLIRLAELSQKDASGNSRIDGSSFDKVINEIQGNETLAKTMTPERLALFESMKSGAAPTFASGAPRQRPEGGSSGGLVDLS